MPDMLTVPQAPHAPPGPQDTAPAPPGREPEGPPFKDVLEDHQARTAPAEGRTGGDDTPKGTDKDDAAKACDPQALVQALALLVVPAAAGTAPHVATPATATTGDATTVTAPPPAAALVATAADAVPATAAPAPQSSVPAPADAATATEQSVPAEATAATPGEQPAVDVAASPTTDAAPVTTTPQSGAQGDRGATRDDGAPAPAPVLPPAAPAPAPAADTQTPAAAVQPVAGTPAAAPTAGAQQGTAPATEAGDAPATQQAPSAPAAPNAPHAHRAEPAHAPAPPSPLNTAHAVERIQAMVHVAHARGVAHARVELHPAELGGVTIQLHLAHDGLRAHIAADRAEALPLLQRAAADLQRTLENRGIDLAGLDFGLAPDAEAGASRDDGRARQRPGAFAAASGREAEAGDDDVLITPTSAARAVELPAGALVDVRA